MSDKYFLELQLFQFSYFLVQKIWYKNRKVGFDSIDISRNANVELSFNLQQRRILMLAS